MRDRVLESSLILSKEEWASIATVLRNYAHKMKKKEPIYVQLTFDLYLEHLPLGYVFSNNRISPHAFLLLIKSGYEIGAAHRVKQFIQDYQHALPEAYKENLILLAQVYILFYEGKFSEALKGLSKMDKFESRSFEIDIRVLKVKCLCRMEEWELTIQHLQALRVFNHRFSYNKEEKREEWRLFINYLLHYCSLKSEQNGEGLELLREEIAQDKTASELAFLRSL